MSIFYISERLWGPARPHVCYSVSVLLVSTDHFNGESLFTAQPTYDSCHRVGSGDEWRVLASTAADTAADDHFGPAQFSISKPEIHAECIWMEYHASNNNLY